MKYLGVLSLALIVACFVVIAQGYNATFGYIAPNDIRVHTEFTYRSSRSFVISSEDRFYPPKNKSLRTVGQCNITGIRVIDQIPKGKGFATLREGGPGCKNATIHFKSARGSGYDFRWEVFCSRYL